MKKRIVITMLVAAGMHLILAIGSVVVSFGSAMEAFDKPDYQPAGITRVADQLAGILMQPGMSLWTPWMSKNMPNVVEWALCIANSLLWGMAFALILSIHTLLKEKRPADNGVHAISENRTGVSSGNE